MYKFRMKGYFLERESIRFIVKTSSIQFKRTINIDES